MCDSCVRLIYIFSSDGMRILQNVYLTSEEYIFQPMKMVVACSTWMINLKFICSFSVTIVGWKCSFWCFDWCICIQMEEENGFSVLIFLLQYSQPETSLDICSTNVCFKCTHFLQFSMETNKKNLERQNTEWNGVNYKRNYCNVMHRFKWLVSCECV